MESLGGLVAGVRAWRRDARSDPNRLVFWDQIRDFQLAERRFSGFAGNAMKDCQTSAAAPFTGAMFWDNLDVSLTERLCATYLRCNGLAQTDRLSMACSVDSRWAGIAAVKSNGSRGLLPKWNFNRKKSRLSFVDLCLMALLNTGT
jgi:hypothetical protein